MSTILAILAIAFMIIIHEWGHFIAARICKVPVYEFAIGFGPLLFKHKGKRETQYSIRLIPLGGFCSFDSPESLENAAENGITDAALDLLPVRQRIFICIMGPVMNLLFAFLIVLGISTFAGESIPTTQISGFTKDSLISEQLQIDDIVYSIDGVVVHNDPELLTEIITKSEDNLIDVVVIRNNEYIEYKNLELYTDTMQDRYYLGIYEKSEYKSVSIIKAFPLALKQTGVFIVSVYEGIFGLFTGKYKINEMSGIVGTVAVMGDYATTATVLPFLTLIALISANLGVMNLLPIPALDGSKILFALIEAIRKKPMNKKFETKITMISFCFLIGLSIVLIISDIFKLI